MNVELSLLNNMSLSEKADFIQDFYEKVLFSPSGIVYCMQKIDDDCIRPFKEEDFIGCRETDFKKWGSGAPENSVAYYGNENSITTSGIYLAAQCYRYKVTGSGKALEQAYKAFNSLSEIYNLSAADGKPGFMCKPYGFKKSSQTSGDQYLHASWGLFEFYPIADEITRKRIVEMSVSFVDFFIKADYIHNYCGKDWDLKGDRQAYNAILVMLNMIAWYYTEKDIYLQAALKFLHNSIWQTETILDEVKAKYSGMLMNKDYKKPLKLTHGFSKLFADYLQDDEILLWESNILAQFVLIAADIIYRIKPDLIAGHLSTLTSKWMGIWKYGVGSDFAPYYWYAVNMRTDEWRSLPLTPLIAEDKWPFGEKFMGYISQIRWGEPLARFMQASELAFIYSENKDEAKRLTLNILNAVDEHRIRWMFDFDRKQLLPDLSHMYNVLSSEVAPTWLASYWRGKLLGIV